MAIQILKNKMMLMACVWLSWIIGAVMAVGKVERNMIDPNCPSGPTVPCTIRTYFIAAEEVEWDYAPSGVDHIHNAPVVETDAYVYLAKYPNRIGGVYIKAVYTQYTDATFTNQMPKEPWMGLLGPIIRAEVGDVIKVVFRNKASFPFGMHPHGVLYNKQDEGAAYGGFASKSNIQTNETYTYTWIVPKRAGPGPQDGNCTLWGYHSHFMEPGDVYSGLVGAIIIYNPGVLHPTLHKPMDVDKEFVLFFMIYNENLSYYLYRNIKRFAPELSDRLLPDPSAPFTIPGETWAESNKMHSVNGRMYGNLDGLDIPKGSRVRWHLMAFGTEMDIHTVHWHSETVLMNGHRVDVVELFPATFRTVEAIVDNPVDHQMAGMSVLYRITNGTELSASFAVPTVSKLAMKAAPALRPGRAIPERSINDGTHQGNSWILFYCLSNVLLYFLI